MAKAKIRTISHRNSSANWDPYALLLLGVFRRAIADAKSVNFVLHARALSWLDSKEARQIADMVNFTIPDRDTLYAWARRAQASKAKAGQDKKEAQHG